MSNKFFMNVIYNILRAIISIIFPIIIYAYSSRILGVVNMGKVGFSTNIISYFILIAGLGIQTFATREGAKLSQESDEFNYFSSKMFYLSLLASLVSSFCLIAISFSVNSLSPYKILLLIQVVIVISHSFNFDWLYMINGKFFFIMIRTLIVQIIAIILMFLFIRTEQDLYNYIIIYTISKSGIYFVSLIGIRKMFKLVKVRFIDMFAGFMPILWIFFTNIASSLYVNLGTTLLGFIENDKAVGLYTSATNVFFGIKQLLFAIGTVYIPKLTQLYQDDKSQYNKVLNKGLNLLMLLLIPIVIGGVLYSKEIILLYVGKEFIEATNILVILFLTLIPSLIAYILTGWVMIINDKERQVLYGTILALIVNVIFNIIFINLFGAIGSAISMLMGEATIMIYNIIMSRKNIKINFNLSRILFLVLPSLSIIISYFIFKICNINTFINLFATISISAIVYLCSFLYYKKRGVL